MIICFLAQYHILRKKLNGSHLTVAIYSSSMDYSQLIILRPLLKKNTISFDNDPLTYTTPVSDSLFIPDNLSNSLNFHMCIFCTAKRGSNWNERRLRWIGNIVYMAFTRKRRCGDFCFIVDNWQMEFVRKLQKRACFQ